LADKLNVSKAKKCRNKAMKTFINLFLSATMFLIISISASADFAAREIASNTFYIPKHDPDVVITANTMRVVDGKAFLEGNVRATKENDILTCNRAIVNNDPQWVLASLTPKLHRKEALPDLKLNREMQVEARNIFYDSEAGKFNASNSVTVRLEERSYDLATYSWVIITSDAMVGYRDSNRMIFSGNVKIKDKDHFGRGNRLDYLKDSHTAILTGNAFVETKEFNAKTGEMEKRTIEGQKITYNTETKEATSE
jgi:lipopolysaccharide export system protein LptA